MNTLNLRIIHTHDTQANWDSELLQNFVPKAGELIVYDKDANHTYERFKIGDGVTKLQELPFTIDSAIMSIFNVTNNVVCLDGGRITTYSEEENS